MIAPNGEQRPSVFEFLGLEDAAAAQLTAAAVGMDLSHLRRHAARTRPSSTAAVINTCKSVTPSEAVRTIRCAIFAFVAGCHRSILSC